MREVGVSEVAPDKVLHRGPGQLWEPPGEASLQPGDSPRYLTDSCQDCTSGDRWISGWLDRWIAGSLGPVLSSFSSNLPPSYCRLAPSHVSHVSYVAPPARHGSYCHEHVKSVTAVAEHMQAEADGSGAWARAQAVDGDGNNWRGEKERTDDPSF